MPTLRLGNYVLPNLEIGRMVKEHYNTARRSALIEQSAVAVSGPQDVSVAVENERINAKQSVAGDMRIGLLTGGQDRHYALGLAVALAAQHVCLEVVGGDEVDCPEMHSTPRLRFLNLRGSRRNDAPLWEKTRRLLAYYGRLMRYGSVAEPNIFHILWNNKIEWFDRTVLMLFYKLQKRKLVLTAHNVNAAKRDGQDSPLNRLTLRTQYQLADHIFVHTEKMKSELVDEFGVRNTSITVIPYGINNAVPDTGVTRVDARRRLGLHVDDKVLLFCGAIAPYKGLDLLVDAFEQLVRKDSACRLVIAGNPKAGCEKYLKEIQRRVDQAPYRENVIQRIEYIPDADAEIYFKSADVLVMPYRHIFQSGILFWSFSFGLPVVATDVGSFRDDVVEGETGFLCTPDDSAALACAVEKFFTSDLFSQAESRRQKIREFAHLRHSWEVVADKTREVYERLLQQ